ncbi:hypothetical protein C1646_774410 [Rhizophagus diaphanus]|nr:hypothetical protein C1646_774410 [Rhizophagus diaphanus] [Rhizophagus sp. MUCL 43196]
MIQAAICKDNNKGKQNIQYDEDFTNFLIILGSFSTPIAKDIPLLNFPPVVITLIANNGSDNVSTITSFYQELLTQIAPQLNLTILSIGSDGAIIEFKAQVAIQSYSIDEWLTFKNDKFGIDFSCPIFSNVGPVIRVQDPKHAKKTSCNAIMSGTRLLTLGSSTARFEQLLKLSNLTNSVIEYVTNMSEKYPDFISVSRNFLADQSFTIFIFLAESMILLVKIHRKYYPNYSFLPWMHGSEACEHFFGMVRQINSDFNYSELLQLVPKVSQYAKALRTKNIIEKSVCDGKQT